MDFASQFNAFWRLFYTNGGYKRVFSEGLKNTLVIAIMGLIIGIVIGTIIAAVKVMPKYKIFPKIIDKICSLYVALFRGTPIIVQLIVFHFVIMDAISLNMDTTTQAIIIFGLNSGAYVSEIMRGGINSVDKGQLEAGRAVGLGYWTTMLKIVLPQAIKNIVPTLGNEFIALMKDTSVVNIIAADDLYRAFVSMGGFSMRYYVPYLMLALSYFVLILFVTLLVKIVEHIMSKSDRRTASNKKNSKNLVKGDANG